MIARNGGLIMELNHPEWIMSRGVNMVPYTLQGKQVWVCKHSPHNITVLRSLGLKVPSLPMREDWKFTGRYNPYIHQGTTARFLVAHDKCANLSDMGTGKTAASIWAAEYLMQLGDIRRVLITCPLSVLHVWVDELFTCAPHRTHAVLFGDKAKRIQLLGQNTEYCIINHDGIATIHKDLEKAKFDLIICDEASTFRNPGTKRFKIFRDLTKTVQRLWLQTGSPAPNEPTDAWALIKLVLGAEYKTSRGAFKELVMRKVAKHVWIPRKDAKETIYSLLQPAIRFRKEDCLDLPSITYVNRECPLSPPQVKAFEQMRKHFIMEKADGTNMTAANAAVKLIKLVQICCGVVKDGEEAPPVYLEDGPRLSLLEEIIREAGNKAVVFIPYVAVMERIKQFLDAQGFSAEVVNGSTSSTRRQEIFNQFQHGTLQVLLAHPRTAAHGLTLTASSYIIWYAPIFSAELYEQGNARIHRPGQTKPCTIVHMGASTLEWNMYKALEQKLRLQEIILREYEELVK